MSISFDLAHSILSAVHGTPNIEPGEGYDIHVLDSVIKSGNDVLGLMRIIHANPAYEDAFYPVGISLISTNLIEVIGRTDFPINWINRITPTEDLTLSDIQDWSNDVVVHDLIKDMSTL